jgi:hypothetical protein
MRSSFRSFVSVVALVAGLTLSEAQAQETRQWITIELEAGNYKLSSYEQNGLYYCSSQDQKIVGSELLFMPTEPGQDPRHVGTVEPMWTLLDLTPGGRPDANEQIEYECCRTEVPANTQQA